MPCARKSNVAELRGFRLEDIDERRADDLALALGVGDAGQAVEEQPHGVDEHERQLQPLEPPPNLLGLVEAHDAVVDEDAGQPIADGAMDEERRDGRVDAAAQAAHHSPVADLRADALGRLLDERRHRPVAGAAADVVGEVAQDVEAAIGVRDLGVEQERVEPLRRRRHRRDRRVGARRRDGEAGRRGGDEVAVAGPDAQLVGHRREERRAGLDPDRRQAELAMRRRRDLVRRSGRSSAACRSRCRGPARRSRARRARSAAPRLRRRSSDRPTG